LPSPQANKTKPIGAVILAAGFSSRFGGRKLLAPLSNGKTVFQQTLERVAQAFPEHLVVTRPEMASHLSQFTQEASVLSFDHADLGMGATLAFAAQNIRDWDGCVVCLGDMPFVTPATYRAISERVSTKSIITPVFESKMGNPVAFGSDFFEELRMLTGDNGGRRLTVLHPYAVEELSVADPGVLQDIDTPEELKLHQEGLESDT